MKPKLRLRGSEDKESSPSGGGSYFLAPKDLEFVNSGCALFDCILGGGYPLGRMVNIVGDKSTGKTLLAIEACVNFARDYPTGDIVYVEPEAAFDVSYAAALGLPVDRVEFGEDIDTVEDLFEDLEARVKALAKDKPLLYIVDSMDAITSKEEKGRRIGEGSFNLEKQKQLGQLFRRLIRELKKKRVLLLIISQVREKIGVMFGEKYTRTGGKALDFYASQIVWLSQLGTVKRVINKMERVTGVKIKANCKKNKVGFAYRSCEFSIRFGYGVDDFVANMNFLRDSKNLKMLEQGLTEEGSKLYLQRIETLNPEGLAIQRAKMTKAVNKAWMAVEKTFQTGQSKY